MTTSFTPVRLKRCLQVLEDHLRAENDHDLVALMKTFARSSTLILNGQPFEGPLAIEALHDDFGFGDRKGFSGLKVVERRRHVAPDAVILEQSLSGRHTGTWSGFAPTGKTFEIAVCTIYCFDEEGKLAGERVFFDRLLLLEQLGIRVPRKTI